VQTECLALCVPVQGEQQARAVAIMGAAWRGPMVIRPGLWRQGSKLCQGQSSSHNRRMSSGYLWVKAFHIVFVASWFAGLFYLPRIFVNLAMVAPDSRAERERLLLMGRKLLRFSTLLMVPALALGFWLWLGYGVGLGADQGWMHAKLALVLAVIAYHHACGAVLRRFERNENRHPHRWYRVFNEVSVLGFIAIVVLVVVKPF
jgi:putative membrane protein